VGEGDLTFAASLAKLRRRSGILIATTYDSQEQCIEKYSKLANRSRSVLQQEGAIVYHDVDATNLQESFPDRVLESLSSHQFRRQMKKRFGTDKPLAARLWPFDRIIFNFPHSGEQRVHINRELLRAFFVSARAHLTPPQLRSDGLPINGTGGKVVVTLKKGKPYDGWNLPMQAAQGLFELETSFVFDGTKFEGYSHQTTNPEHNVAVAEDTRAYVYVFAPTDIGWAMAAAENEKLAAKIAARYATLSKTQGNEAGPSGHDEETKASAPIRDFARKHASSNDQQHMVTKSAVKSRIQENDEKDQSSESEDSSENSDESGDSDSMGGSSESNDSSESSSEGESSESSENESDSSDSSDDDSDERKMVDYGKRPQDTKEHIASLSRGKTQREKQPFTVKQPHEHAAAPARTADSESAQSPLKFATLELLQSLHEARPKPHALDPKKPFSADPEKAQAAVNATKQRFAALLNL